MNAPIIDELASLLQQCTVLIRSGDRGSGFFVAPHRVLTCAHVVKRAAPDRKVTVEWQGRTYSGQIRHFFSKLYGDKVFPDVALIEVEIPGHPCVLLDREFRLRDPLHCFGFPGKLLGGGETLTANCEGFRQYAANDPDTEVLKFKDSEVPPGVSGSPLLNERTRKVCAIVKRTRGKNTDRGGLAVRIQLVFTLLPHLEEENRIFHLSDSRWSDLAGPRDDWFGPYKKRLEQDFGEFTIPARVPLRDVYVIPRIRETIESAKRSIEKREKQDRPAEVSASRTLAEAMAGVERKLISIVGGPGQGKSTLLAHQALEWVEGQTAAVPLMVRLRSYADRRSTFTDYLEESGYLLPRERTEALLQDGKAMLLLDALDEVPGDLRAGIIEDIRAAAAKYPAAHIILTGRPASYTETAAVSLSKIGFRRFELDDFDDTQIREFLSKWGAWKKRAAEPLLRAIGESPSFRRLAGKPLLLTLAASLQKVGNRAELYGEFVENLLDKWDRDRGVVTVRADYLTSLKISVLEAVAVDICESHEGSTATSIPERKLEKLIKEVLRREEGAYDSAKADKIINGLRDRDSMLEEHDHSFEFVHRTMLEYFCARAYCTKIEDGGELGELKTLFGDKWRSLWWGEILILICGGLRVKALPLVRKLIAAADLETGWRATFLAAECLREMEPLPGTKEVQQEIQHELTKLLRFDFPYMYLGNDPEANQMVEIRAWAADRLALWPDRQTRDLLVTEVSRSDNFWSAARMVAVVAGAWKDDRTLAWLKGLIERDGFAAVRIAAVREIARGWKADDMRTWLKSSLDAHPDPQVRFAACWEIAWDRKDEESRTALVKCAQQDPDQFVQEEAMRVLVWFWWDASTEDLLFQLAQTAKSWYARKAAIGFLGGRSKDPRVKALCLDRAANDERWLLRHMAQLTLRSWPDEETMLVVRELALNDRAPTLRGSAAVLLAELWPDAFKEQEFNDRLRDEKDPEARAWMVRAVAMVLDGEARDDALADLALHDEASQVRLAAVVELVQKGSREKWLPLLRTLAETDGDAGIRRQCVAMVTRNDPSDDVVNWLKERVTNDKDAGVQEAAIRDVGRRSGDPATREWMLGLAPSNIVMASVTRRWPNRDWLTAQRGPVQLQELARAWPDPETRKFLLQLMVTENQSPLGYESIKLLAWYWPDDLTLTVLQEALRGSLGLALAIGAADSIGWRFHDDAIWQLLSELALGDADENLRKAVMASMATQWREGRTRDLLMDRAVYEKNLAVRHRAISILGDTWNDEETTEFLQTMPIAAASETPGTLTDVAGQLALQQLILQLLERW